MINALKTRIRESDRPVGTKRPNHIKLPSQDFVYGYKPKADAEGADKGKLNILLLFFSHFLFQL